jgi:hypothetical protein
MLTVAAAAAAAAALQNLAGAQAKVFGVVKLAVYSVSNCSHYVC